MQSLLSYAIRPQDLSVIVPGVRPGDLRPDAWAPKAALRLLARPGGDAAQVGWLLASRHRGEDAATADTRPAKLVDADGQERDVVVKIQRTDPALNSSDEAICARFNREQYALVQLGLRRGALAPESLNPAGEPRMDLEALKLEMPVTFCLAAEHALTVGNHGDVERESAGTVRRVFGDDEAVREVVGKDPACRGCRQQKKGWETCREWLVAVRVLPDGEVQRIIPAGRRALILPDVGETLQQAFDAGKTRGQSLPAKLTQFLALAKRLESIHQSRWLHLDLNMENVCLSRPEDGPRPIDFGHAEQFEQSALARVSRIPLRRTDFAAPEMQMRRFPVRVEWLGPSNDGPDRQSFKLLDLRGWPRSWRPHFGDLLELEVSAQGRLEKHPFIIQGVSKTEDEQVRVDVPASPHDWASLANRTLDATVSRSAGPAADLYAFGLMMLCWLIDVEKPVVLRDELAYFERALLQYELVPDADLAAVVLDDESWLHVYRRVFGLFSELLDVVVPHWERRFRRDEALIVAFRQMVRIGVKCVVRYKGWGYATLTTKGVPDDGITPFTRVREDLDVVEQQLRDRSGQSQPLPVSIEGYLRRLERALPRELRPEQRATVRDAHKAASQRLAAYKRSGEALAEVHRVFVELSRQRQELDALIRQQRDRYLWYYSDPKKWFRRWVWWPLRNLVSRSPEFNAPYPEGTGNKVRELAEVLRKWAARDFRSDADDGKARRAVEQLARLAEKCEGLSDRLDDFDSAIGRPRFATWERRRVEDAYDRWCYWHWKLTLALEGLQPTTTAVAEGVRRAEESFRLAGLGALREVIQRIESELLAAEADEDLGDLTSRLLKEFALVAPPLRQEYARGRNRLLDHVRQRLRQASQWEAIARTVLAQLLANAPVKWRLEEWNQMLEQLGD